MNKENLFQIVGVLILSTMCYIGMERVDREAKKNKEFRSRQMAALDSLLRTKDTVYHHCARCGNQKIEYRTVNPEQFLLNYHKKRDEKKEDLSSDSLLNSKEEEL